MDDTGERLHSYINRLKHLGVQIQDKESGDPQEVTIQHQHSPASSIACSVGPPGSPHQEEILGVELVNK